MLLGGVVQNAAYLHLGCIQFVLLAARDISLDFRVGGAIMIELAASPVEGKTIYILNVDSCAVWWFFGQYVAPWVVCFGVLYREDALFPTGHWFIVMCCAVLR